MSFVVVGYYTPSSVYDKYVKNLIQSLQEIGVAYKITPIKDQGSWIKNVQYKPVFLKQRLEELSPNSLVYVDVDAIFCGYPKLFDELERDKSVDFAVHILDHTRFGRDRKSEVLSGTIYMKNNDGVKNLISEWCEECRKDEKIWDQAALSKVLKRTRFPFYELPEQYCTIFDYMMGVQDAVIKHFQASREIKRSFTVKGVSPGLKTKIAPKKIIEVNRGNLMVGKPKKMRKGSLIRFERKWR